MFHDTVDWTGKIDVIRNTSFPLERKRVTENALNTASKQSPKDSNHFKTDKGAQNPSTSECASSFSTYKAFFYAFLAALSLSVSSFLVRFSRDIPAIQMSLYRFLGMMVFSLPLATQNGGNIFGSKGNRMMLLFRSISGIFTVVFSFFSFRYLPIGEASVIVYSTPVFATVFARILLKEPCGVVQSIIVGLTLLGIIFIINPSTLLNQKEVLSGDHTIGVFCGIAGLFSQCLMVILTRQTRKLHYSIVSLNNSMMGTLINLAVIGSAFSFAIPQCGLARWIAIAVGASSSLGQIFYINALQLENVGPVSTVRAACDITIAVTWQVAIFKESLDALAISGTVLVVISVILIGLRKWILQLPKDSHIKRKLHILTY